MDSLIVGAAVKFSVPVASTNRRLYPAMLPTAQYPSAVLVIGKLGFPLHLSRPIRENFIYSFFLKLNFFKIKAICLSLRAVYILLQGLYCTYCMFASYLNNARGSEI